MCHHGVPKVIAETNYMAKTAAMPVSTSRLVEHLVQRISSSNASTTTDQMIGTSKGPWLTRMATEYARDTERRNEGNAVERKKMGTPNESEGKPKGSTNKAQIQSEA